MVVAPVTASLHCLVLDRRTGDADGAARYPVAGRPKLSREVAMGRLGDFLEVVYGPADRFQTVRATIHQWHDHDAAGRAVSSGSVAGRLKADAAPAVSESRVWESDLRVWVGGPGRVRVEETRRRDGMVESMLAVVGGGRWWQRDFQGHVEEGQTGGRRRNGPNLTDVERHFSPASLREYFAGLALEPLGPVRTAGRECVRVRSTPRPDGHHWPHWLGFGADEHELHADPEHGVLLFTAAKFRGELLETNEVTDVAFDEPLADDLFTYEARPGEQVRPADPIVEHLTLAAAVARMPFTVLVPGGVPEDHWVRVEVMFHPPRVNSPRPHLTLMYFGEASLFVDQSDTRAPRDEYEWESVERDGRRMEISDPGTGAGQRLVRLEHMGTHVEIRSELDRDRLLELAASLRPAAASDTT
jgi:hypothetical protein